MLTDKIVLVTGAGSGIGRATAQVLATYGAIVIAADIDDKQANATAALIQKAGGQSDAEHVDVANEGEVDSLIQNILARHGRLDGAFNNAGIEGPTAKVLDVTVKEWERVQRVNLTGVFMCIKREIEQMVTQDTGGAIVSTASVAGLVAIPGAGSYNSAKHGVVGLTKSVALEYARKKIRVNAVCPGFIETPMLGRVTGRSTKIRDQLLQTIPMGRVAQPNEIAEAVAWLLSDRSSYVSGVALPVDGGWTAQ